jgi:hydroxyacylglutathione hydrolase
MRVARVVVGPLDTNCWVVSDDAGGPAAVIDPGDDLDLIEAALDGRPVAAVVLTHAHFDHIGAVADLIAATGAPLMIHDQDAARLASAEASGTGGALFGFDHVAPPADRILHDGDTITVGELTLQVLHTPGHTAGGICLYAPDPSGAAPHLISGDTLFSGSVGRTDFPGGDGRALSQSIAEKLAPLPPETLVHPGHGPDTSIGREAHINPFWPRG